MAGRFMKYMNKPESNGAVRCERDARQGQVNLIGWMRIQGNEANALQIRLTLASSGSRQKK
jgi:hypothetical protein